MSDKMFRVVPLRADFPENQLKLIEGIINRPEFVSKTVRATELFIQRFMMPEILYGKQFTQEEKEAGMTAIVEEIQFQEARDD